MDKNKAIEKAREIAANIGAGHISPYDGAKAIWDISLSVNDEDKAFHDLDPYVYAASEWENRPEDREHFENEILKISKDFAEGKSLLESEA